MSECAVGVSGVQWVCHKCAGGVSQVCLGHVTGVLGVSQVCWICHRCAGGVTGVLEVCHRCVGGVTAVLGVWKY